MSLSVTVLGCGAATPGSAVNPSAQVVDCNGRLVLVDCGEGTQVQLRRNKIKFSRIGTVCISHMHGDHVFGLPGLISTFHLLGRRDPLTLIGPPALKEWVLFTLKCNNFNGHTKCLYPEGWKYWNGTDWENWTYLTDYNTEYFNPIIKYWETNNYNYDKFKTIRECFFYFPYTDEISKIIYEIEKIKPIFEYMSIVGNNGYSAYGSSEGIALSYVLEKFNLEFELLSTNYYNYTYYSKL
jgi:hypothetical protein